MFTSVDKFVRAAFVRTIDQAKSTSEKYTNQMNFKRSPVVGFAPSTNAGGDDNSDDDENESNVPLMPSLPQLTIQKRNSILGGLNDTSRKLLKTGMGRKTHRLVTIPQ